MILQKIIDTFNHIQSRFSYRQKFVFLAFLFVLAAPIPTYWNFYYLGHADKLTELHKTGLAFQSQLALLQFKVAEHAIVQIQDLSSGQDLSSNHTLRELNTNISLILRELNTQNSKLQELDLPNLSSELAVTRNVQLLTGTIYGLWQKINDWHMASESDKSLSKLGETYLELLNQNRHLIENLRDSFELTLSGQDSFVAISRELLLTYPRLTATITEATIQSILQNQPTIIFDVLTYNLKEDSIDLKQNLSLAYRDYLENSRFPQYELYTQGMNALEQAIHDLKTFTTSLPLTGLKAEIPALSLLTLSALEISSNANSDVVNYMIASNDTFLNLIRLYMIGTLTFGSLLVSFYVVFRVLSGHLLKLMTHIEKIAQGDLSSGRYINYKDTVGQIGLAFSKMGTGIKQIVVQLKDVGTQLKEFSQKIVLMADDQEKTIASQESKLESLVTITKEIALKSRDLATIMNLLISSSQNILLDSASTKGIEDMKDALTLLVRTSNKIFESLNKVNEKVTKAGLLIEFMERVSDQARLLALNASIETIGIDNHREEFTEVTRQIERFAETTATSSQEIQTIISGMFARLAVGQKTAKHCVREIHAGVNRLLLVSNQLTSIAREGQKQTSKFLSVNTVMQEQAKEAEMIIHTIEKLSTAAHENTNSISQLRRTIEELAKTTQELHEVLNLFFSQGQTNRYQQHETTTLS